MAIFRDEFNKMVIRLGLIRDKMVEDGFTETAQALNEVIARLNAADQTYIRELAAKRSKR